MVQRDEMVPINQLGIVEDFERFESHARRYTCREQLLLEDATLLRSGPLRDAKFESVLVGKASGESGVFGRARPVWETHGADEGCPVRVRFARDSDPAIVTLDREHAVGCCAQRA